jgi:hypothetical protein
VDEGTVFLLIFFGGIFIVIVGIPLLFVYIVDKNREGRWKSALNQAALQYGLRQIPEAELPSVTTRAQSLLQIPEDATLSLPLYLRVSGYDALFYQWFCEATTGIGLSIFDVVHRPTVHNHAYVVLGPRAPSLCVLPKRWFGKPADPIGFPEDPTFSEAFWTLGTDGASVRRYVGPDLRQFLSAEAQGEGCRFHAGPEGVALIRKGHASESELAQMKTTLERLAALAEAAARR